jgi:hypothetical protein
MANTDAGNDRFVGMYQRVQTSAKQLLSLRWKDQPAFDRKLGWNAHMGRLGIAAGPP